MAEWNPRANDLFLQAAEIDVAADRSRFLEKQCAGDVALRGQVEALLATRAKLDSFLDRPLIPAPAARMGVSPGQPAAAETVTLDPNAPVAALAQPPSAETPGTRIGRYKLLQQIGEGGMGNVWMAEQLEPVRRTIALKIVKAGLDSAQVVARFEAERQVLAMMDHPNIARVLDAGSTEAGRPYFVMELVKGVPITQHCDARRLTLRQRLELFIPVCQALQHAHQKGIIHRDIKPSNVLVAPYDGKPVVKVIDFGIAKATGQRLTEKTLFTQFGAIIGTLQFMSPEQAELNNQDIDTRSDIYSLGVLLYELVTGTTPLDMQGLRGAAFAAILTQIIEAEPPRPSTRISSSGQALAQISLQRNTEPARLAKLVRGELDWIVMKALEKDRTRRYETAGDLVRDVESYLQDEPVEACPPSLHYRAVKFCRRNRGPVLAAGLVLLALAGGIVGSTWGLLRAERAWEAESKQRQIAQAKEWDAEVEKGKALAAASEEQRAKGDAVNAKEAEAKERQKAEAERDAKQEALVRAEGLRLTAQSSAELHTDPTLGLLLAIEAARIAPSKEANDALVTALEVCHEARTIFGHQGAVLSARFTPDGKRIMSCARDGTVRFWDAGSGKQLFATPGFREDGGGLMAGAALSPDGNYFVTLYAGVAFFERDRKRVEYTDRVARLWDAATCKQLAVLRGHQGRVRTAAFSADSKRLVTGSNDTTVRIWEVPSGKQLAIVEGHASIPCSASFSRDGRQVLTVSSGYQSPESSWVSSPSPRVVESDPEEISVRKQDFAFRGFVGDSTAFVSYNDRENTLARVWDAETGKHVATILKPKAFSGSAPYFGHFSPDGKRVALGVGDDVQVWDIAASRMLFNVKNGGMSFEDPAAWSPDGKRLATIRGNYVSIWDSADGRELTMLHGHENPLRTLLFSPDGKLVLTTSVDRTARVWNAETGEPVAVLRGHQSQVNSAGVSPDGKYVVTAAADGTVRLWWLDPPKNHARPLAEPISSLSMMAFSPDGRYLATGANDFRHFGPRIWDTATGKLLHHLKAPREGIAANLRDLDGLTEVSNVAFSPDSRRLLSVANEDQIRIRKGGFPLLEALSFLSKPKPPPDGTDALWKQVSENTEPLPFTPARIWDVATGEQLVAPRSGEFSPSCACFSPDGRKVLVGDSAKKRYAVYSITGTRTGNGVLTMGKGHAFVRVYDAANGRELLKLPHEGEVLRAEFSADGRRILVSAKSDRVPNKDIKVWDAETGSLLFAVEKTGSEQVACFAPNGKRIVVFSPAIRILDATSGKELTSFDGSDVWVENWKFRRAVLSPFSPDGNKLLAYGKEGLGLLDVQTGKQLVAFRGHSGALRSALFSTDGRFVVTASDDQTARVWDVATGKEVHLLRHKAGVQFAVMTPDGRRVATASDTVRVWDLELLPIAVQRKPRELSSDERERFGIR